ncbi:diacylglycerol kinase [Neptunicella marina]|uniref:diacylglycerol kinase n=1 Tax=Neptunicella marina TaxID=2125989 RepID=UPI0030CA561A
MNKKTGFRRISAATGYSISGLKSAFISEAAFRQECVLFLVLFPVALLLPVSYSTKLLLVSTLFLVLIVELINSAIEATVDRIGEEHHPLSAKAKDIGSAAVFICLIFMATVWGITLWSM